MILIVTGNDTIDTVWYYMILYDTVWYYMILYDTVWYYMILYDTIWYCMILYDTVWYYMICPKKKYSGLIRNNFETSKAFKEK
jgi:hypothetical protein